MRRTRSTFSLVSEIALLVLGIIVTAAVASSVLLVHISGAAWWLALAIPGFIAINIIPGLPRRLPNTQLRFTHHGVEALRIFLWSSVSSAAVQVYVAFALLSTDWTLWLGNLLACVGVEAVVFSNGILAVYIASTQMGIRRRLLGVLLGWIPLVNVGVLTWIIRIAAREVNIEESKMLVNEARHDQKICSTRYPILLVHGVFFRDTELLNYWGRIPDELIDNGATVFYGNHESASSVADAAAELTARIKEIIAATGCPKVNVIAHSKGGLDIRWAASCLGAAPMIASITTINTPHRGCGFADYLLDKIPASQQQALADRYNLAATRLGDMHPDFLAAVHDLTAARCETMNRQMADADLVAASPASPDEVGANDTFDGSANNIYCQSVGSLLKHATSGKFPLNFTHPLVHWFDGGNDGLVSEPSFSWGENYTFLKPTGRRGISHADMIDLNRENIPGFDVREFYVNLLAGLRQRGL